jgi:RNA recognition motif-containing protein
MMRIYVGNLSYEITSDELRTAFAEFGKVDSADVVMERTTGRSRGYGFVEMPSTPEAEAAIAGLNGKALKGRALTVNQARPRSDDGGARR